MPLPQVVAYRGSLIGRLFRGKLLDALERLHRCGHLELSGALGALRDRQSWRALLGRLYAKDWVAYGKPPFGGVDSVHAYLGRYTHRIGLSNRRLRDVTGARVTFATRHGKHTSLPPLVFLRRLLEHTLPPGFVRIRHYGLHASSNVNSQLERARAHLVEEGAGPPRATERNDGESEPDADEDPLVEIVRRLCGVDLRRCPRCCAFRRS